MRRVAAALLFSFTLTACAEAPAPAPAAPTDERLETALSIARFAFREERYDRAEDLYRRALDRARESDDIEAITIVSFELSATLLRLGEDEGAIAIADRAAAERARRGAAAAPSLTLAAGAAELALERPAAARARAAEAAAGSKDPRLRARAVFIDGRAAAMQGDRAGLGAAIAALSATNAPGDGDLMALTGHAAALDARWTAARAAFDDAATARRGARDYRAMADALAGVAEAEARLGNGAASADAWLRAGRSAAARGDALRARLWLTNAERQAELSGAEGIASEAAEIKKTIEETGD